MKFNANEIKKEIEELEARKYSLKEKLSIAKKNKNFLQKTGLNIGVATKVAQLNKAINERKRILNLLNQKESLKVKKDIIGLEKDVNKSKDELRKHRKEMAKNLNDSVFGTGDIFGI